MFISVIFRLKNVGYRPQKLDPETCMELLKRPLGCNMGGTGDGGRGVVAPNGDRWKYR